MKAGNIHAGRLFLAIAVLALILMPGLAAAAPLSGVVLNSASGEPVRGAELRFEGTKTPVSSGENTISSDLNGLVKVDLAPGTYTVLVTKEGFKIQKVSDVEVTDAGGNFAVVLDPSEGGDSSTFTEEVTVTAEADLASAAALLTERKRAVQISDSIGSDEMSKNAGGDAAGALKRVTGVSLQDNKFAYVRGLGDRYSNTTLNGSRLPSTEFEKKVVPLDLFPSELIQKITVSKSYTVDNPGDFAAGFIELSTIDLPARQTASFGVSGKWNSVTTGDPYLEFGGGLGFSGSGGQPLPASIPSDPLVRFSPFSGIGFTPDELEAFGESLVGEWRGIEQGSAPFNFGFDATYGNSFGKLGFVLSANHENSFSTRDEINNIFFIGADGGVVPNNTYRFDFTNEQVREAVTANLAYHVDNSNHLRLRTLFTTLANAESRFQEGFFSDVDANIQDTRVSHMEQEILNLQLSGDHYFNNLGPSGSMLEWSLSRSEATTDENKRETLYEESRPGVFILTDNAQSGFLYFNALEDEVDDVKLDWSTFWHGDKTFGTIKTGFAVTRNERHFGGRRLRFFLRNTSNIDLTLAPEEIIVAENIDSRSIEIQEVTRPSDEYVGDHDIAAGYAQVDLGWGKWRFIGGLRLEDSTQEVVTFNPNFPDNPPILSEVADTDILPSLSLVYQLKDDINLRFSASQTLNRPEFRELAPFSFTHVAGAFTAQGNPNLERAKITSFDARWEWFPSGNEVIAASIFFKDFEDPIEGILLTGAQLVDTWDNVESAQNFGFELEVRRHLGSWFEALEDFTFIFNFAFVESEVEIDPATTVFTNDTRALVGQPDNTVNFILEWNRPESGSVVRLLYNFTDDKIAKAGGFGLPDVIEEARGTVDLVWGQSLGRGFSLKLSGSNLLDEDREWTQGTGVFRFYEPGRSLALGLTYKPFG